MLPAAFIVHTHDLIGDAKLPAQPSATLRLHRFRRRQHYGQTLHLLPPSSQRRPQLAAPPAQLANQRAAVRVQRRAHCESASAASRALDRGRASGEQREQPLRVPFAQLRRCFQPARRVVQQRGGADLVQLQQQAQAGRSTATIVAQAVAAPDGAVANGRQLQRRGGRRGYLHGTLQRAPQRDKARREGGAPLGPRLRSRRRLREGRVAWQVRGALAAGCCVREGPQRERAGRACRTAAGQVQPPAPRAGRLPPLGREQGRPGRLLGAHWGRSLPLRAGRAAGGRLPHRLPFLVGHLGRHCCCRNNWTSRSLL